MAAYGGQWGGGLEKHKAQNTNSAGLTHGCMRLSKSGLAGHSARLATRRDTGGTPVPRETWCKLEACTTPRGAGTIHGSREDARGRIGSDRVWLRIAHKLRSKPVSTWISWGGKMEVGRHGDSWRSRKWGAVAHYPNDMFLNRRPTPTLATH